MLHPSPDSVATPAQETPYPDELRLKVDSALSELQFPARSDQVAGLSEAMRYSLLAGGKRIRPVLVLATARALDIPEKQVMPLALALEMIHTYSLIHDDLPAMDDDDLRRGMPTCHVKFGEDVAILAGDALYAEAFRLLLTESTGAAERVLKSSALLAAASGVDGMVGGQYLDVSGKASNAAQLQMLHRLKTGRLIAAAVGCVVELAGLSEQSAEPYHRFSEELGLLFQIVDDILDVTGSDEDLGKPQGSDAKHGKLTYVTEYGVDGARQRARVHHAAAIKALDEGRYGRSDDLRAVADFMYTRSS